MEAAAIAPYEHSLRTADTLHLRTDDGRSIPLEIARWLAPADEADATVLDRCTGPVLDVGCGPGRFVAELATRGVVALGVDIAEFAIGITNRQGLPALHRDVFGSLPGEGRWPTVLLMDGNIGIGADPVRLLRRIASLLEARGRLIVESHPDEGIEEVLQVRFSVQGRPVGPSFGWAHVGATALARYAAAAGFGTAETWTSGARTFHTLVSG